MSIESRRRQRGVTMIELILFIMIIGVALAAIIGIMNFTSQHSADPVRRKQALMLAEALLEEVELARFSFCDVYDPRAGDDNPATGVTAAADCAAATRENWGPEANNQRPFDNINDYVASPNTPVEAFGANGNLVDANGNPLPLAGFKVTLSVAPDSLGGLVGGTSASSYQNAQALRITVTVGYDDQTLTLEGYRTRYAPLSL